MYEEKRTILLYAVCRFAAFIVQPEWTICIMHYRFIPPHSHVNILLLD